MAGTLILAEQGRSRAPILVAPEADRVTRFAARELAAYFKQMSGASFRVKEAPADAGAFRGPAVFVGPGWWSEDLKVKRNPAEAEPDAFVVSSDGERVCLVGNRSRGDLYAVYALLEELGCRFVEPLVEVVPQLKPLKVPQMRKREKAGFVLRNLFRNTTAFQHGAAFNFMDAELHLPQIAWMAKRRMNHYEFYVDYYRYDLWEKHKHQVLEALLDRGFDLEVTHHSLHYFCPPDENHDFGGYGPATYERNHPEWYEPAYECGSRGRWQTNVGLRPVQEVVFERYLEYCGRNPELKIVGLWPDDVPMNAPYPGLSRTDGYLKFWNKLAARLAKERPGNRLGIIAYFELIEPPEKVAPAENLHCWYCPIEMNYFYPITDRRNRDFLRHLEGWAQALPAGRLANFEYYGWCMPLTPTREKMRKDLPAYQRLGAGGVYGWSGFSHNLMGQQYRWALDYQVFADLLWDPKADTTRTEETWAKAVFGDAGDDVLDFYSVLLESFREETAKGLVPSFQWVPLPVAHHAQACLARGRKRETSEEAQRRLDLLEVTLGTGLTNEAWRKGPPRKYWEV